MSDTTNTVMRVEDRGAVRVLTLDRPEVLNAFDRALYRAAAEALDGARTDDRVHAAVLTGAGRAFSAGQDLDEMAHLAAGEEVDWASRCFSTPWVPSTSHCWRL